MSSRETPASRHGQDPGRVSAKTIEDGLKRHNWHQLPFRWLQLARITEIETDADDVWTGTISVELLETAATRRGVILTLPMAGQAQWAGGPPERDAMVVLGWLPTGIPVVVAYVPFPVDACMEYKDLPEMVSGEYLIRAGVADENGIQIPGGSVLWDRHGRVRVRSQTGEAEALVGAPLASDGEPETDPKTGNPLVMQFRSLDGDGNTLASLSFDDAGNIIVRGAGFYQIVDRADMGSDPSDGDRLLTFGWAREHFFPHIHTAPGGVTGTPTPTGLTSGFTKVARSK